MLRRPRRRTAGSRSWGASDVFPVGQEINYQTLRQIVRLSAGGKAGARAPLQRDRPLSAGHRRRPCRQASDRRRRSGRSTPRPTTRSPSEGLGGITIPPGAAALSDPVEIDARAAVDARRQPVRAALDRTLGHPSRTGLRQPRSRATGTLPLPPAIPSPKTSTSRFFIDEVDVDAAGQPAAVVALGDSITDGYRSEVDANHRWPDRLAERLAARPNAEPVGVVNAGVSGNRILARSS